MPYFSIVIPAYNCAAYLAKTLKSVLDQNFSDFEVIVIDDGSTDNTIDVVLSIKDERVKLISQANSGVSAARNAGIEASRGAYVALLDGDDIWMKDHLSLAYTFFSTNPAVLWYASNYKRVSEHDHMLCKSGMGIRNISIVNYLKQGVKTLSSSSVIFKKSMLSNSELFPTGVTFYEDVIAWDKLALISPILGITDKYDVYYVSHDDSTVGIRANRALYIFDFNNYYNYIAFLKHELTDGCHDKARIKYLNYQLKRQLSYLIHNMIYSKGIANIVNNIEGVSKCFCWWFNLHILTFKLVLWLLLFPIRVQKIIRERL